MSASDSCVVFAILRRSFPTRRVEQDEEGDERETRDSASSQLSRSMPTIVAITVVTLCVMFVAVFVTTFWTPPMSFEMRDCTSPVRVRVKNASDNRCRWRKTAARRSCMTRCPTWFESSVWITPRTPVTTAIAIIPPAFQEIAALSCAPMATRTRRSKKAGTTPRAALTTMSASSPASRRLYGATSGRIRRWLARRTAGSAGRSAGASLEWKNIPIATQGTS